MNAEDACICCETRQRSRELKIGVVLQMCDYCYSLKDRPQWRGRPRKRGAEKMAEKLCAACEKRKVSSTATPLKLGMCFTCYMDREKRLARAKEMGITLRDTRPKGKRDNGKTAALAKVTKEEAYGADLAVVIDRTKARVQTEHALRALVKSLARQAVEDTLAKITDELFEERSA